MKLLSFSGAQGLVESLRNSGNILMYREPSSDAAGERWTSPTVASVAMTQIKTKKENKHVPKH